MVKSRDIIFGILIVFFLGFSFYPTIFELNRANNLLDSKREFVLEHNYYWPDFNLYLSKIRQGYEGRLTALERYTSEPHRGSLIQEFYVVLGFVGRVLGLEPNGAYQLGRIILSPLLLLMILMLIRHYFKSLAWQVIAFLIVIVSGSLPRLYLDQGVWQVGRFMEWWSNIDALQRITFIPHILFGQVVSFYLLYELLLKKTNKLNWQKLLFYVFLGNLTGLVFPPSLITLMTVIVFITVIDYLKQYIHTKQLTSLSLRQIQQLVPLAAFCILSSLSMVYIYIITKQLPWSALVDFHRTHPMLIPFTEYIKGTGLVFYLGISGAVIAAVKHDKKLYPLIFWLITTFFFALLFTYIKEQSPLRFTQTGLFIPLGILGSYFINEISNLCSLINIDYSVKKLINTGIYLVISIYLLFSLYMMKVSLDWQTTFITQRANAFTPAVPYPPQTMYPLKEWMDGIRYLKHNSSRNDVVLAMVTAGNYIPAYAGNTVYFGQANTVDYERKQNETERFFKGEMTPNQAEIFIKNGRIKYIFSGIQEQEINNGKPLESVYTFLTKTYQNNAVAIYTLKAVGSQR